MADTKISALDAANTEALRRKALGVRGCLVGLSADLTTINAFSTPYYVPFNAETYDTDAIHDNVTNNTRLTVPSGWGLVRVGMKVLLQLVAVQEGTSIRIEHYNSSGVIQSHRGLPFHCFSNDDFTEVACAGSSAPIQCAAGDYFTVRVVCQDNSVTVNSTHTSFWMELLA